MIIEKLQKLKAAEIKMILIALEVGQLTVKNMACLLNVSGIFMSEDMVRRRLEKLVKLGIFEKKRVVERHLFGKNMKVVYFVKDKLARSRRFAEDVIKMWEDYMNLHK